MVLVNLHHAADELEWQCEFFVEGYAPKVAEHDKSVQQLPGKQVYKKSSAVGNAHFHFIWTNYFMQPALPGMSQRIESIYPPNRYAEKRFFYRNYWPDI